MPDYSSRTDELLKEIDAMPASLPEEGRKKMREAVTAYVALRKAALDDLLKILEDASESATDTAGNWRSRCDSARSSLADPLENALKNVVLDAEAAAAGYRWQMETKAKEEQFFSTLSGINAASVRDYMVKNLKSLKDYTATLDEKWKKIASEEDKLQAEEQKLYKEMLDMTNGIIKTLAEKERTFQEKAVAAAAKAAAVAAKSKELSKAALEKIIEFVTGMGVEFPDEYGDLAAMGAEQLKDALEKWLANHALFKARVANYQALVQAEKGGILPLFRETREDVEEYWQKNGTEPAKRMIEGGKSSMDSWLSGLPTSAQKDDAKRFYDAAYAALEKHFKAVESAAADFEKKWNGIFKGALSPTVGDELVDSAAWRMNARTLAEIGTPDLVDALIKRMDGYYEVSFEEPLDQLKAAVEQFPEEHRANAVRAVEEVKKSVEASVRDRIKDMHRQIAESLNWFKPAEIEKVFDRGELKDALD